MTPVAAFGQGGGCVRGPSHEPWWVPRKGTLVLVSILAEQCINIFKKLLNPSSVPGQHTQAATQRRASNQEDPLEHPTMSTMDRVQGVPCPTVNLGHLPT